ncbi:DUF2637 domain-containing protein [Streptomyces nanhaiensis]|uniref:DUF2637 domain-containing protein n=1 Tax=Streptomyces nanhaiensis TaxID=679319 RepID=UPI00399D1AC6
MNTDAPAPARVNGWDRAAIVALGAAGCALSYDALQQMAEAIHVRGPLTYLFPLVIDGFIAYGVRALLVLRTARFTARLYVWTLFGTATAASIWANALHAVRLNQQTADDGGLRLGDTVVGVLSTLAPLALAGAVHLYILIARRTQTPSADNRGVRPGDPAGPSAQPVSAVAGVRPSGRGTGQAGTTRADTAATPDGGRGRPAGAVTTLRRAGHPGHPGQAGHRSEADGGTTAHHGGRLRQNGGAHGGRGENRPGASGADSPAADEETDTAAVGATDTRIRRPSTPPGTRASIDELLPIARQAVADEGRVTRKVVATAVRSNRMSISNDRLTDLVERLRKEQHTDRTPSP